MILMCWRTASLSVVSLSPSLRPQECPGCGRWHSGTMRVVTRRAAMLRRARPRWRHSQRAGGGSEGHVRFRGKADINGLVALANSVEVDPRAVIHKAVGNVLDLRFVPAVLTGSVLIPKPLS